MKPKTQTRDAFELFQAHFEQMLDPDHELVQLARRRSLQRCHGPGS